LTIELKPEQERIIQEEIQSGHFRTAEEVLDHALIALRDKEHKPPSEAAEEERVRRAQAAAAHIRELSKGLSLEGLNIKDLIEEGRM
jgi:Arc/MetJ-type ribon-helix-helix transcriptional regulator